MSNMNVSNRSQSMSSITSTPKVSTPKPLSRTASTSSVPTHVSKPEAFKSANATTAPADNKAVENQIQQSSSMELRRNEHLMNTEIKSTIMSDLNAPARVVPQPPSTPAPPIPAPSTQAPAPPVTAESASSQYAKSVESFNKTMAFKATEVPTNAEGKTTNQANPFDTLMMRHNPLASATAKREGNIFRSFAKQELAQDSVNFLDASYKLSKMNPQTPDFDRHVANIYNNHIKVGGDQEVNLSHKVRKEAADNYENLQAAQEQYGRTKNDATEAALHTARAKMMDSMGKSVKGINQLLTDTWGRYEGLEGNSYRRDVYTSLSKKPFSGRSVIQSEGRAAAESRAKKENKQLTPKMLETQVAMRRERYEKNGSSYREYMQEQRQQAAAANQGTGFRTKLYNRFIAPWRA